LAPNTSIIIETEGLSTDGGSIPATTKLTWISLVAIVAGALTLAAWVFLRAQGVETWEATRRQKWMIVLAIAAMILLPVMFADTNYDNPAPHANNAPAIRGLETLLDAATRAPAPRGRSAPCARHRGRRIRAGP
jgi:hypothetical protein